MAILLGFQRCPIEFQRRFQRIQLEFQGGVQDAPRSEYPFMPEAQDVGFLGIGIIRPGGFTPFHDALAASEIIEDRLQIPARGGVEIVMAFVNEFFGRLVGAVIDLEARQEVGVMDFAGAEALHGAANAACFVGVAFCAYRLHRRPYPFPARTILHPLSRFYSGGKGQRCQKQRRYSGTAPSIAGTQGFAVFP